MAAQNEPEIQRYYSCERRAAHRTVLVREANVFDLTLQCEFPSYLAWRNSCKNWNPCDPEKCTTPCIPRILFNGGRNSFDQQVQEKKAELKQAARDMRTSLAVQRLALKKMEKATRAMEKQRDKEEIEREKELEKARVQWRTSKEDWDVERQERRIAKAAAREEKHLARIREAEEYHAMRAAQKAERAARENIARMQKPNNGYEEEEEEEEDE
jgi:hypothetical protein